MSQTESNSSVSLPLLGTAEHVKANLWVVKSVVMAGNSYAISCPNCGVELVAKPKESGTNKLRCENCGTTIGYQACQEETRHEIYIPETQRGCLQWGRYWSRQSVALKPGENVVGRKDKEKPSDIMLDDPTVSRQSIAIKVLLDEGKSGYVFHLTVMHAKNPVMVNELSLQAGQGLYLKFGDTITLGRTQLKFIPYKK